MPQTYAPTLETHVDVLIVGAGLSGISAGYHLQTHCPGKTFAIVEARDAIGGTWDLFRYPGVRSDSDMFTLGYSFKPWTDEKSIAEGWTILRYIRETAAEYGIDRKIRFGHRVKQASWSSDEARWTVEVERVADGETVRYTCGFLFMCSGYYSYASGYAPEFPGLEQFAGRVVHPQQWTADIDYDDRRVVVIGSGATAVTLVPAMAETAAHVTMLQRSPTYMVSRPSSDPIARAVRRVLPSHAAARAVRWKNVLLGMYFFRLCRKTPERAKALILGGVKAALGPDHDIATHFTPSYNPWEQRLCLVPDSDFFKAVTSGRASVVTDRIDRITATGIRLQSGKELPADIIVTATGLQLNVLGDVALSVDGRRIEPSEAMTYRGVMLSDVPNFAFVFGYTNASWTLKCDLACTYVCRLLNHMDRHGYRQCTPHNDDPSVASEPAVDFSSGYFQRALDKLPKQGSKAPWKLNQNYLVDIASLRFGSLDDQALAYSSAPRRATHVRSVPIGLQQ